MRLNRLPRPSLAGVTLLLRDNGWRWTAVYALKRVCICLRVGLRHQGRLDAYLDRIEREGNLPGLHSVRRNFREWNSHDWQHGGEEWTPSPAWKNSLIENVLRPFIQPSDIVLEVGPGAGRWSAVLCDIASKLILVDVSDRCIALCRERFRDRRNIEYLLNDGIGLSGVASGSVDRIWSFDVFVHISPSDTQAYVKEFSRVLKPGGLAIVHHPHAGGRKGGWRSRTTSETIRTMANESGLTVLEQFDSWGESFNVRFHGDMISVLQKPPVSVDMPGPRSPLR